MHSRQLVVLALWMVFGAGVGILLAGNLFGWGSTFGGLGGGGFGAAIGGIWGGYSSYQKKRRSTLGSR